MMPSLVKTCISNDYKNGLTYRNHETTSDIPTQKTEKRKQSARPNGIGPGSSSLDNLESFDQHVFDFIYEYPGLTVLDIQKEIDFRKRKKISESLKFLARRDLITNIDNRIYPVRRGV